MDQNKIAVDFLKEDKTTDLIIIARIDCWIVLTVILLSSKQLNSQNNKTVKTVKFIPTIFSLLSLYEKPQS